MALVDRLKAHVLRKGVKAERLPILNSEDGASQCVEVCFHCSVVVRCFPMCIRCAYTWKVASTKLTGHTTETTTGYIIVMQGLLRGDGSTSTPPILTQLQGDSHGILMGKLIIPVENLIPRGKLIKSAFLVENLASLREK